MTLIDRCQSLYCTFYITLPPKLHQNVMLRFILGIFLFIGISIPVSAQCVISHLYSPAGGDKIARYEANYIPAGQVGKAAIWDFSNLEVVKDKEEEVFVAANDTVTGYGLATNRYVGYKDGLNIVGYSGRNFYVKYLRCKTLLQYPMAFGHRFTSLYYGEGMYSHKLYMTVYGRSDVEADAMGTLILPQGDTLRNVLRVHEAARVGQLLADSIGVWCNGDSTSYSLENIDHRLASDSLLWLIDSYRWYASGYRYPVFETAVTTIVNRNDSIRHFARSYYYPIDEQKLCDEDQRVEALEDERHSERTLLNGTSNDGLTPSFGYRCSLTNTGTLKLCLALKHQSTVSAQLTSVNGMVVAQMEDVEAKSGNFYHAFDVSTFISGAYLLSVTVNGQTITEKFTLK